MAQLSTGNNFFVPAFIRPLYESPSCTFIYHFQQNWKYSLYVCLFATSHTLYLKKCSLEWNHAVNVRSESGIASI